MSVTSICEMERAKSSAASPRHWNGEHEGAANEMAGQLLIPSGTARGLAYRGVAVDGVARRFRVSPELARWRLNVSGGYQMRRAAGGQSV